MNRRHFVDLSNNKNNINANSLKQTLNSVSTMLIWDDTQNHQLIQSAFQIRLFDLLLQIFARAKDREIVNIILDFFTKLMTNFQSQKYFNYLISHHAIVTLVVARFGNMGNQVADFYINYLKVLSRRINKESIVLFFNKKIPNNPILFQSIRFYNHPQSLVRNTSRNILLSIAKIKHPLTSKYLVGFPFSTYYIHLAEFIKEYWISIDGILRPTIEDNRYQLSQIQGLTQDLQQLFIFIDEFVGMNIQKIDEMMLCALINDSFGIIYRSLQDSSNVQNQIKRTIGGKKVKYVAQNNINQLMVKSSLFFLSTLFKNFTIPVICDAVALIFFSKDHTKHLQQYLMDPIKMIASYDKNWKFKGFWDSHEERINKYCSKIYFSNRQQTHEQQINKVDTLQVFGLTNNFYQVQIEDIFGMPIDNKPLRIGAYNAVQQLFQEKKIKQQQNYVSQQLISFLVSRDDTLVMLTLNLYNVFLSNRNISQKVLLLCGFTKQIKYNLKIQQITSSIFKLFIVQPPCYRICTYFQGFQLIKKIYSKVNQNCLSQQLIVTLKKALKISIQRITPYIYGGRQWQKVIGIYLQVKQKFTKRRTKTLKTLGLLQQEQANYIKGTPDIIYDEWPRDAIQQAAYQFTIYLIANNIYNWFNFTYENNNNQNNKSQKSKYQEGMLCNNITDEKISAEYKKGNSQKYSSCDLVLMGGYLVLIKDKMVQMKINYEFIELIMDKSDFRKVFVQSDNQIIWLIFQNPQITKAFVSHCEDSKSILFRYRLTELIKQIQNNLKKC